MVGSEGARVVLYARVSTDEQARSGLGLEVQQTRMRAYAEAHGLRVVAEVVDQGVSAKNLDRPGWNEAKQLIESRRVDGVVILKLDRLTRSTKDLGTLLEDLDSLGVALHSVDENLDTASAGGRLVLNVIGAVAQWEREAIGERTKSALAAAKTKGTYLGQPPVGYRVSKGKLQKTGRYAIVTRAKTMHASGCTAKGIAETFNAEGIPTGSGRGQWWASSVTRLLHSP